MAQPITLLAPILASALAVADPVTVLSGQLEEDFSDRILISGGVLVGASLGIWDGAVDLERIALSLPARDTADEVCVEAKTRDGRYRAQFSGVVDPGDATVVALNPDPPWRFLRIVSEYEPQSLALIGRMGGSCSLGLGAPVVPVRIGSDPVLTIAINSQRSTSVRAYLSSEDGVSLEAECFTDATVRSVSFNSTCAWQFSGTVPSGRHHLLIERRTRVGPAQDNYSVILP